MLEEITVICPYCGEEHATLADCSAGNQTYYEDCSICCHPILLSLIWNTDQRLSVRARRDDD